MSKTNYSQSFLSEQQNVSDVVADAIGWLRGRVVDQDSVASAEIVLAEALNNVVEHAYEYRKDGQIKVALNLVEGGLALVLTDQGNQFPGIPQKRKMDGNSVAFEDLPEGGFGWFLIHSLTRKIQYAFVEGSNVLNLEMDLGK